MRSTELNAVLGINQLKKLDKNIRLRNRNFLYFINNLDKNKYFTNFDKIGISNYAFPIILKNSNFKKRNIFEKILEKNSIEFRRGNAGGGNQLRQPYLKKFLGKKKIALKNTDYVHDFGYYIGNFPDLKIKKISLICKVLNQIH
jgi:CDP-6-deoxy-D-xylo-4-hexulose-3-dehydrase